MLIALKQVLTQVKLCNIVTCINLIALFDRFGIARSSSFFFNFVVCCSVNFLMVLSIDRYIFIKKPLHYSLIMSEWKTFILLVFALSMGAIKVLCASFVVEVGFLTKLLKIYRNYIDSFPMRTQMVKFVLITLTFNLFQTGFHFSS